MAEWPQRGAKLEEFLHHVLDETEQLSDNLTLDHLKIHLNLLEQTFRLIDQIFLDLYENSRSADDEDTTLVNELRNVFGDLRYQFSAIVSARYRSEIVSSIDTEQVGGSGAGRPRLDIPKEVLEIKMPGILLDKDFQDF
eukprot:gene21014-23066_t